MGWDEHLDQLDRIRARFGKPVLLTEAGVPAIRGAAAHPWNQSHKGAADPALQARTYEALLHAVSDRPWVRGVYFWKVMTTGEGRDPYIPAPETEQVLRRWWGAAP